MAIRDRSPVDPFRVLAEGRVLAWTQARTFVSRMRRPPPSSRAAASRRLDGGRRVSRGSPCGPGGGRSRRPGSPFATPPAQELTRAAAAVAAPPAGFTDTTVWSGLETPTTLRWAPTGACSWPPRAASSTSSTARATRRRRSTPTCAATCYDFLDRGLLGLAVDPQFSSGRPYLYVLYTYDKDPNSTPVPALERRLPRPAGRRRRRLRRPRRGSRASAPTAPRRS